MHPRAVAVTALLAGCTPSDPASPETGAPTGTHTPQETVSSPGPMPVFLVAGQSNAEGNVRLSGLQAIRDALPSHGAQLTTAEREAARLGYREGVGDWCNPDEDYSDQTADAAIDALRAGGPADVASVLGRPPDAGPPVGRARRGTEPGSFAAGVPVPPAAPPAPFG